MISSIMNLNNTYDESTIASVNSEVGKIIDIISKLHERVSEVKPRRPLPNPQPAQDNQAKNNDTPTPPLVEKETNESDRTIQVDPLSQLDHDLIYIKNALSRLKVFEGTFSESIEELQGDLELILSQGSRKSDDEIRRISQKFLNLKSKIPPVHSSSSTDTDAQQRRRINQSKELPNLPDKTIFKEHNFFKEFLKKYDDLEKDKSSDCLLCFAVFPENAVLKKRLLLHWWIAEGFLDERTKNGDITREKVADDLLLKFEKIGFIVPVDKKHREVANSFRMNPLVRSAVITLAKQKKFFDIDSEGIPTLDFKECQRSCLVYDHKEGSIPERLEQLAKEIVSATELAANNGGVNLTPGKSEEKELANNNDLTPREIEQKITEIRAEIKTVFNVSEDFPDFKFDWFSKMKKIKVLYLGRWQSTVDDIPHVEIESTEYLKGLKYMKSLRLLSLQGVSGIRELPSEISYLTSLEILDLRACYSLDKLPDEIGKLNNLTHFDISECFLLDGIPKKLSSLSKLQVLKGFVITKRAKDDHIRKRWCSFKDLDKLKQLRKLSVNINTEEFPTEDLSIVLKFKNLVELKVSWGGGSSKSKKAPVDTGKPNAITRVFTRVRTMIGAGEIQSQNCSILEKLDLQCFPEEKFPDWVDPDKLENLKNLYIRGGRLSSLGKKEWKLVKVLRFKYLNELKTDWKELQKLFPKLEYLEKFKCHKVTLCPSDGNGVWEKNLN